MTAPRFENVLSIGNILQIIVILVAMAIAWGDAKSDIDALKASQAALAEASTQREIRLRSMEISASRADERIENVLRSMDELKAAQRETNNLLRELSK